MSILKIKEEAKNNNTKSMIKLGRCYLHGIEVEKDEKQAFGLFKKAADAGDFEAKTQLAYMLLKGIGVRQDENKAYEFFKESAQNNEPVAMFTMGVILKKGMLGRNKNPEMAKNFFDKAAQAGNFAAKYEMALYYEKEAAELLKSNDPVTKNKGVALNNKIEALLVEAADNNYTSAKYALAIKYIKSPDKTKQDKAFELMQSCVDKKIPQAYMVLAYMYDLGIGTEKNFWKSFKLYKEAHNAGINNAGLAIAYAYMTGLGVKKNYTEALNYCRNAVNDDVVEGNYYAGLCFKNGYGVDVDYERAASLFELAADVDFAPAFYQLGYLAHPKYKIGDNTEEALEYYASAAKLGDLNAKAELAEINFDKDKKTSLETLKQCADENSHVACEILGTLFEEGTKVLKDLRQAMTYYKKACSLGSTIAIDGVLRLAKLQNDVATLKEYEQKQNLSKDCDEYIVVAKALEEKKDYEKAAFWYAMAEQYANDQSVKESATIALDNYELSEEKIWTKKN